MEKMSAFVSKDSFIKKNTELLILPPSVYGKLNGYYTIKLHEIQWTTVKTYNLVNIQINWWGERQGNLFEKIKILPKTKANNLILESPECKPLLEVRYQVNTNKRLFQSYLKNCEPLTFEIFSTKTNNLIGRTSVDSNKLQHLEYNSNFSLNIISSRNFKLGNMILSFDALMGVQHNVKDLIKTPSERDEEEKKEAFLQKHQEKVKVKHQRRETNNKENIIMFGQKKEICFREPKIQKRSALQQSRSNSKFSNSVSSSSTSKSKISGMSFEALGSMIDRNKTVETTNKSYEFSNEFPSYESKKTSLIDYLSGQNMTKQEEYIVLREIIQKSPSHSIIEQITMMDSTNPTKIESIQINLFSLELNDVGLLEVKNYCNKSLNSKFIFKCAITSKLFETKDVNILSPVFETPSKKTVFNKELVQRIRNSDGEENLLKKNIIFGFCVKAISKSEISPYLIGFTRIRMSDFLKSNEMTKSRRKCLIFDENNCTVGTITLKIQTGQFSLQSCSSKEYRSHGRNFIFENTLNSSNVLRQIIQKQTSHPSTSNDDSESQSAKHYENKNMQTDSVESSSKAVQKEVSDINDRYRDTEMVDPDTKDDRRVSKIYQGLLFVESLKNVKDQQYASKYFVTYEGFWNECQESTNVSVNLVFNHLKQFPIICDDSFLKRVQNNHLELRLWEKTGETPEKLIGTTKVPLHQFYIAFKDSEMIEHLSKNKLPIISTDTWCNFISPLSNDLFCQVKILLAIGSENQIDYLIISRGLNNLHKLQSPIKAEIPASQDSSLKKDANAQIKSKLTAFIESLSQKLPDPNRNASVEKFPLLSCSSSSSSTIASDLISKPHLRKTSELLESLQKALAHPPSSDVDSFSFISGQPTSAVSINQSSQLNDCIKMEITIEQAANLPKVIVKKCRNKRKSKALSPQRVEYEPYAYSTFEAATDHLNENFLPNDTIKSHEGIVYCTGIIKSCSPEWNQTFTVFIQFDVVKNPQKKFVIKVWRKSSYSPAKVCAQPFEDSVIGFTAIDLSVLLTGLPVLSGYYNIVDFSGRCNGQLKISIKPMEDIMKFRKSSSPLVPLMRPLNIDVTNSSESSNDGSTSVLTRTLKRKFTELDEITQRLKARLFDVTGDENFDPDEEFERDLNTAVDEDEDLDGNFLEKDDFNWLKKDDDSNLIKIIDSNKTNTSLPSTSSIKNSILTRRDTGTGCSSTNEIATTHHPFSVDELLKKYDMDTLINPNIFKNLLDPNLTISDSTPTLVPQAPAGGSHEAGNESDITTVSSISSDQIQTIQKALQQTSLHDSRKDPDGRNHPNEQ